MPPDYDSLSELSYIRPNTMAAVFAYSLELVSGYTLSSPAAAVQSRARLQLASPTSLLKY